MSPAQPASDTAVSASVNAALGDSPGEANPAVAYSRLAAPPASECAWCGHGFDGADTRRPGRILCSKCGAVRIKRHVEKVGDTVRRTRVCHKCGLALDKK